MGLNEYFEYSLGGAKRNGREDGSRNIPGKDQKEHSAYERQLAMKASKGIRSIAEEWEKEDRNLKGNYVSALKIFIDTKEKAKKEKDEAELRKEWIKVNKERIEKTKAEFEVRVNAK